MGTGVDSSTYGKKDRRKSTPKSQLQSFQHRGEALEGKGAQDSTKACKQAGDGIFLLCLLQ